jgi:hypothetical protein
MFELGYGVPALGLTAHRPWSATPRSDRTDGDLWSLIAGKDAGFSAT